MSDAPADPQRRRPGNRRGPDKRQRPHKRGARLTADEAATFDDKATQAGVSVGALIRHAVLGIALPTRRQRRVRADLQKVAALLAEAGDISAELGKQGSNLNQLAYQVNAGRVPVEFGQRLDHALKATEEAQLALLEIRTACMAVLGFDQVDDG